MALTSEEQKAFFLLMGIPGEGVNPEDEESLKKAFRKKAKTSHPDLAVRMGKDPALMQLHFQELNDAFNILMERIQSRKTTFKATAATSRPVYKSSKPHTRKKTNETARKQYKSKTESENNKTRDNDFFFSGKTPRRNLRFAEYLYYSGSISWTDLIQALVWQYRNRPKLGELATESGILNFDDVLEIIKDKKPGELFGEAALRLGYMDQNKLNHLIRKQKKIGLPIGHYFTNSKMMTKDALYKKLSENRRHNIIFDDQSDS